MSSATPSPTNAAASSATQQPPRVLGNALIYVFMAAVIIFIGVFTFMTFQCEHDTVSLDSKPCPSCPPCPSPRPSPTPTPTPSPSPSPSPLPTPLPRPRPGSQPNSNSKPDSEQVPGPSTAPGSMPIPSPIPSDVSPENQYQNHNQNQNYNYDDYPYQNGVVVNEYVQGPPRPIGWKSVSHSTTFHGTPIFF